MHIGLMLLVYVADDRKVVPAEHCLQMLLPDEPWEQSGANTH